MENSKEYQKRSKNLRSIFLVSVLFFVAGASIIMVALFNSQNKDAEQMRNEQRDMQRDQVAT